MLSQKQDQLRRVKLGYREITHLRKVKRDLGNSRNSNLDFQTRQARSVLGCRKQTIDPVAQSHSQYEPTQNSFMTKRKQFIQGINSALF